MRVRDVLRDNNVQTVALWHLEGSHRGVQLTAARSTLRAEGVVLAAAGEVGAEVVEVAPSAQRQLQGGGSNDAAAQALAAGIAGDWPDVAVRAVAAAATI